LSKIHVGIGHDKTVRFVISIHGDNCFGFGHDI